MSSLCACLFMAAFCLFFLRSLIAFTIGRANAALATYISFIPMNMAAFLVISSHCVKRKVGACCSMRERARVWDTMTNLQCMPFMNTWLEFNLAGVKLRVLR